jgi:hypothetical protein
MPALDMYIPGPVLSFGLHRALTRYACNSCDGSGGKSQGTNGARFSVRSEVIAPVMLDAWRPVLAGERMSKGEREGSARAG